MKFNKIYNRMNPVSRGFMHMSVATERLLFFIICSCMWVHIISCLWLFGGQYYLEVYPLKPTWLTELPAGEFDSFDQEIVKYKDYIGFRKYLAAVY